MTVIVNVLGVPAHPLSIGVTVILAIAGIVSLFTAMKGDKFPVPVAGKPIEGLSLVHE